MARYIDADRLSKQILDSWDNDNHRTIQASAVHRQEHQHLMRIIEKQPTADVVPKSEVEKIFEEIEKTIRAALILIDFSYKHNQKEMQCKKECYEDFLGYIAELKKKYTEGEQRND